MFRTRAWQELRVELARLNGALETLKDHETRIRRTERYMYAIPASVVASAGAIVIAWMHTH